MRVTGKATVTTLASGEVRVRVFEVESGEPLAEFTVTPEQWWDILRSGCPEVEVDTFDLHARLGKRLHEQRMVVLEKTEDAAWAEFGQMIRDGRLAKWEAADLQVPPELVPVGDHFYLVMKWWEDRS